MRSNERRKAEKASEIAMKNTPDDEISTALAGIRSRLDMLASINAENIWPVGAILTEKYYVLMKVN
jgi:hypothetical protein